MKDKIKFGTGVAVAGQKAWGIYSFKEGKKESSFPVIVVNGAKPGKHVVLIANQHGSEVNGVASIVRFCEEINPKELKGTILAIPSANPNAAMAETFCWMEGSKERNDNKYETKFNMNWIWPGRKGGLLVERAVHEIWNNAIMNNCPKADFVLDIHCHQSRSAVIAESDDLLAPAVASGLNSVIRMRTLEVARKQKNIKSEVNDLCMACLEHGIPSLVIELEGQHIMLTDSIEKGKTAICNLMKYLGLLPGKLILPESAVIVDPWRDQFESQKENPSFFECKSSVNGLYVPVKKSYDIVKKGDLIGEIIDPFKGKVTKQFKADSLGVLYASSSKAVCKDDGSRLFAISAFEKVLPSEFLKKNPDALKKFRSDKN